MIRPGIYRHFKGGVYRVLFIARHSESMEEMVVYQSVSAPEKVWVRPANMWDEQIQHNGEACSRFTYVGDSQ